MDVGKLSNHLLYDLMDVVKDIENLFGNVIMSKENLGQYLIGYLQLLKASCFVIVGSVLAVLIFF